MLPVTYTTVLYPHADECTTVATGMQADFGEPKDGCLNPSIHATVLYPHASVPSPRRTPMSSSARLETSALRQLRPALSPAAAPAGNVRWGFQTMEAEGEPCGVAGALYLKGGGCASA